MQHVQTAFKREEAVSRTRGTSSDASPTHYAYFSTIWSFSCQLLEEMEDLEHLDWVQTLEGAGAPLQTGWRSVLAAHAGMLL